MCVWKLPATSFIPMPNSPFPSLFLKFIFFNKLSIVNRLGKFGELEGDENPICSHVVPSTIFEQSSCACLQKRTTAGLVDVPSQEGGGLPSPSPSTHSCSNLCIWPLVSWRGYSVQAGKDSGKGLRLCSQGEVTTHAGWVDFPVGLLG